MDVEKVTTFILDFLNSTECIFGPCPMMITERLDAAIFPDELEKFKKNKCGLYIISTKGDSVVRYVGISRDIVSRIYTHIGHKATWARNGQAAHFPNCGLAYGRHWQHEDEIQMLRNAEWEITGVFSDPPHLAGLLEMAILHFGKIRGDGPTINIAFGDEARPPRERSVQSLEVWSAPVPQQSA